MCPPVTGIRDSTNSQLTYILEELTTFIHLLFHSSPTSPHSKKFRFFLLWSKKLTNIVKITSSMCWSYYTLLPQWYLQSGLRYYSWLNFSRRSNNGNPDHNSNLTPSPFCLTLESDRGVMEVGTTTTIGQPAHYWRCLNTRIDRILRLFRFLLWTLLDLLDSQTHVRCCWSTRP